MAALGRTLTLALLGAMLLTMGLPPQTRVAAQPGPDVYEPDDSPDEAKPLLLVNLPQRRTFHRSDDQDWVYFFAESGERVVIYTTGACDTILVLYSPDGREVGADDDSGENGNAMMRFAVPEEGTYYAMVARYPGSPPCDEYQLIAGVIPAPGPDQYEPDDAPGQARPLVPDAPPQSHSFHTGGDQDWLSLTVNGTTGVRVFTTGPCDTYITLLGPNGQTVLAQDDDSGGQGNAAITYTLMDAGTYYVRVRPYDDKAGLCDNYQLAATLVTPTLPDAFEPDDSAAQAKQLPLNGSPQERSLHVAGDLDWVWFQLNANDRIFLTTTGSCDTVITLFGADGQTTLAEDDDSGEGANAALLTTVRDTGRYYARVRLFGGQGTSCASYQLEGVVLPAGAPVPGTPGTPGTPAATPTKRVPTWTPQSTPQPPTPVPTRSRL